MPDPQSVESMSVSINDTRDDNDIFTIPVQKSGVKQKKDWLFRYNQWRGIHGEV